MTKKKELTCFIIIFFVIYATDTMVIATNADPLVKNLSHILIIFLMFFLLLGYIKKSGSADNQFLALILACLFLYMSMIYTEDFTGGYILKMILFITGYFFVKNIELKKFSYVYIKCMYIIAIFSIIGFFLSFFIPRINVFPVITNISKNQYAFTLFNNIPINNLAYRNYGPFWEPGVYQAYLNLAVIFYLFVTPCFRPRVIFVLIFAILTTCSTTGYVVLFMVLCACFFKEKKFKMTNGKLVISLLVICGIIIILLSPLRQILFRKFSPRSYEFNSFFSRFSSIYTNLILTFKYPIFGVGPNNVHSLALKLLENLKWSYQFSTSAQTNAILLNFSMFGVYAGLYYIINLWKFVSGIASSRLSFLILFAAICLILFTEPLTYSLLFHILIYYRNKTCKKLV